jgi:hypothetical protein
MADQFNDSIPSVTNQITEDVSDIAESLGYLKECFQRILGTTWSNTDTNGFKFVASTGFYDGTYNYTIPTLPTGSLASAKFMMGLSTTIIWMYLNTAPPGWKAISTGADMVLGIAGGSAAYNVNGGNPDSIGSWYITGLTADDHYHTGGGHTHTGTTGNDQNWAAGSIAGVSGAAATTTHDHAFTTGTGGAVSTTGASSFVVSSDSVYRPRASVGKLFQLDTA